MSDNEPFCARCARYKRTCCQSTEIYVTLADVARIEAVTGHGEFYEYRSVQDPAYADQDDDPVWRDGVFRDDGSRRVLKQQSNEDCYFLGLHGCRLSLEHRPLVCRLFPFDYDAERILEDLASGCPTELLGRGQRLLDTIGMNRQQAELWRRQLYQEIATENKEPVR